MFRPFSLNSFLMAGALAASVGAGLTQGQTPTPIPVKATLTNVPADSIVVNTTLTKDKLWILTGFVVIKAGVTLTIEPGTTIRGDATTKGTLMVDRGGYLVAAGTKEEPITFKGPTEDRGAWGGLVLLGKGLNNQVPPGGTPNLQYEALGWAKFGGSNNDDSSGVLTYVRLDGPGFPVDVDRELNGLTLCAVGRKTVIHHIQVHRGDDDGVEWFGGAVNTSHLVVTQQTDDSYDTDHGYSGNSQYMIAIQRVEPPRVRNSPTVPLETVGDNGVECGSSTSGNQPSTYPTWKNVTIIDNGAAMGNFNAKEECGGSYEKMVLVAGGADLSKPTKYVMEIASDIVVNGLALPTPTIDFKDVYVTGKWDTLYRFMNGTPDAKALATEILNAKIKNIPYATNNSYGLYKDLSPSNPEILATKSGAIVDGDLWYQGWTFPGTVVFDLGENPIPPNTGVPTVTLTASASDLSAPATFTLNATANDPDGIAILEILKGDVVVATGTGTASALIANLPAGSHTYTVRAKDSHPGNPLTASQNLVVGVSNPSPAVTLTSSNGPNFVAPGAFTLIATATDLDGIASLEILLGDQVIGSNAAGVLSVNITNLGAGSHTYKVRAKDNNAVDPKTSTQELLVVVTAPPANQAPTVTLVRNTTETLIAPAGYTLIASAADPDGAIASLQILEGDVVLGGSNTGALSVSVTGKAPGIYTYTVKATDNHASDPKTVTGTLTFTVFDPPPVENAAAPTVTLTRSTGTLIAPAAFTLIANAEDANGIDTLQILLDNVVVATSTTGTLQFDVTDKAAGAYVYTARAKDKHATDPKTGSKDLEVSVNAPAANVPPAITFTRSGGADTLWNDIGFTLHALAEDPNGIEILEILLNGAVIGTSTNGVLSLQLPAKSPGIYNYIARAKDKHATDPKITLQELKVTVVGKPVALVKPMRDLGDVQFSASRGQNLVLRSASFGKVRLSIWSLTGNLISTREVALTQGRNAIPMGNLRGVHIVRLSNGSKHRSARVVFSAGN